MNYPVKNKSVSVVLMIGLLMAAQPAQAGVKEVLYSFKEKTFSSMGAAVAMGLWCCGITYWCMKLQRAQVKLERDHEQLKNKVNSERSKRKAREILIGRQNQEYSRQISELAQKAKRLEKIEYALYGGVCIDEEQQKARLSVLATLMNRPTLAVGKIESDQPDEILAEPSNPVSPNSALGDDSRQVQLLPRTGGNGGSDSESENADNEQNKKGLNGNNGCYLM